MAYSMRLIVSTSRDPGVRERLRKVVGDGGGAVTRAEGMGSVDDGENLLMTVVARRAAALLRILWKIENTPGAAVREILELHDHEDFAVWLDRARANASKCFVCLRIAEVNARSEAILKPVLFAAGIEMPTDIQILHVLRCNGTRNAS